LVLPVRGGPGDGAKMPSGPARKPLLGRDPGGEVGLNERDQQVRVEVVEDAVGDAERVM